jgi:hypothetical protein
LPIASTIVIPELQYWINKTIVESVVNKNGVPTPSIIDPLYLPQNSFIELLFNDSYPWDEYNYVYTLKNKASWPTPISVRLNLYPASGKYYELSIDSTGENLFLLEAEELTMLDALLAYRLDSTSVVIIDSTSDISFDSTSNNLFCNYDSLTKPLSQLIFLYLDLMINGNTTRFDNTTLVSQGTLLETFYEIYVLDQFFKATTSQYLTLG